MTDLSSQTLGQAGPAGGSDLVPGLGPVAPWDPTSVRGRRPRGVRVGPPTPPVQWPLSQLLAFLEAKVHTDTGETPGFRPQGGSVQALGLLVKWATGGFSKVRARRPHWEEMKHAGQGTRVSARR